MDYYSAIKKKTFESVLMRWMKLEHYYTEWSKSERKTPIQYTNAYIWNLEMVTMTLYARQQKRCIEQLFGLCGREREWDDLKE